MRFELSRGEPDPESGELVYEGFAHTAAASLPLVVRVTPLAAHASVAADSADAETKERLEKAASALVRASTRTLLAEGRPTPRKIVRWRP